MSLSVYKVNVYTMRSQEVFDPNLPLECLHKTHNLTSYTDSINHGFQSVNII